MKFEESRKKMEKIGLLVLSISKKMKPGKSDLPDDIKDKAKGLAGAAKLAMRNKKKLQSKEDQEEEDEGGDDDQ